MRFAIIASPRTGSSHLVALLNKQQDVFCNAEVFHRRKPFLHWPKRDLDASVEARLIALRTENPVEFLEMVFQRNYGRPHVGFKIFSNHNNLMLERLLTDPDVRKIVLYRRNVLANFASEMAARATGGYGLKSTADPRPKVQFDQREFVRFHDRYHAFYRSVTACLNTSGQTFHYLEYANLNEPAAFRNLLNYIGASPALSTAWRMVSRRPSTDIMARFSNPGDVRLFLHDQGMIDWSHEGEISFASLGTSSNGAQDTDLGIRDGTTRSGTKAADRLDT